MSKVYDRVECSSLEHFMLKMGFSSEWIRRIMACLSSIFFSFKINGSITGCVLPTRRLRQCNPISPYLFLLWADGFSMLLKKATRDNVIHGAKICNSAQECPIFSLPMTTFFLLEQTCKNALKLLISSDLRREILVRKSIVTKRRQLLANLSMLVDDKKLLILCMSGWQQSMKSIWAFLQLLEGREKFSLQH